LDFDEVEDVLIALLEMEGVDQNKSKASAEKVLKVKKKSISGEHLIIILRILT
jgi:hypothetical protein